MVQMQPLSAAGAVSSADRSLGDWQRSTLRGNRALGQGSLAEALEHYRAALALAEALQDGPGEPDTALAALVVSHHNLAELHLRASRPDADLAAAHLCRAHELLHGMLSDARETPERRLAAWRHGRVTYVQLQNFLQRHPGHARARRAAALLWKHPGETLPH